MILISPCTCRPPTTTQTNSIQFNSLPTQMVVKEKPLTPINLSSFRFQNRRMKQKKKDKQSGIPSATAHNGQQQQQQQQQSGVNQNQPQASSIQAHLTGGNSANSNLVVGDALGPSSGMTQLRPHQLAQPVADQNQAQHHHHHLMQQQQQQARDANPTSQVSSTTNSASASANNNQLRDTNVNTDINSHQMQQTQLHLSSQPAPPQPPLEYLGCHESIR